MLVFDGNWLAMRNFHASGQTDSNEIVMSFLASLMKQIRAHNYLSEVVVAMDGGHSRYRGSDESYKEGRDYGDSFKPLWEALGMLQKILPRIGIATLRYSGVEADDIGYWISNRNFNNYLETTLVSIDRDWLISVNEYCSVRRLKPKNEVEVITFSSIKENYNLECHTDFAIYKSIIGDPSDAIPPAKISVGIEEAIRQFKSGGEFEGIEEVRRNYDLIRLDRIVDDEEVSVDLEKQLKNVSFENIGDVLSEHGDFNIPGPFFGVFGKYQRVASKIRMERVLKGK